MPPPETGFDQPASRLLTSYIRDPNPSARVLLSTVFGDVVRPHADSVWLGSLSRLLAPLEISDRLVRTSLRRLVDEGLLINQAVGRRSFYSVAAGARTIFERADGRIYRRSEDDWDEHWTLVVLDPSSGTSQARIRLRRELTWLGLGAMSPNALASPSVPPEAISDALAASEAGKGALITRAEVTAIGTSITDRELAARVAPVERLAAEYRAVIDRYGPSLAALADGADPDGQSAFLVRTLMLSDYRRIVLTDPDLPRILLPMPWVGDEAYDLVRALYHGLLPASDAYLQRVVETGAGELSIESDRTADRFPPAQTTR